MNKIYRGPMDVFYSMANDLMSSEKEMKDIFSIYSRKDRQNKVFLIYEENKKTKKITYKQIVEKIYIAASNYQEYLKNITLHTFVGLKMNNSANWIITFWALLMCGFKPLLINPLVDKDGTIKLLQEANASAIICEENEKYNVPTFKPLTNTLIKKELKLNWENEIAFCTSGTTGQSRVFIYDGKAISHQIYAAYDMPNYTNDIMYVGNKIRLITIIPFSHIFGFVAIFLWYSFFGMTLVFPPSLNPNDLLTTIKKYKCSHIYAVPLFWNTVALKFNKTIKDLPKKQQSIVTKMLSYNNEETTAFEAGISRLSLVQNKIKEKVLGKQIVFCISGGGALSTSTLKTINGLGYPLYNGYGMTEVGITSVELIYSAKQRNKGSVGFPLHDVSYKLLNNELLIKSPYIHIAALSNGMRIPSIIDKDGYFHTGDIAYIDENNLTYIKGKIKDIIINEDGENVYPDEIEAKFANLDYVENLAIISSKDNNKENIILIIHLSKDINDQERLSLEKQIYEINNSLIFSNRIQKTYISLKPLPLNSSKKIKKFELSKNFETQKEDFVLLSEKQFVINSNIDTKEMKKILHEIIDIFSCSLNIDKATIAPSNDLISDLNGDSFSYMEIISEVEKKYNITIPTEKIGKINTPIEFANLILELKNN